MGNEDWYPSTMDGEFVMFTNVYAKIDGYAVKYGLTPATVDRVKLMCGTFTTIYQKIQQNRATDKDQTQWFKKIMRSKYDGSAVTNAPVFQNIPILMGAFNGVEEEFRKFVAQFKENDAYEEADGIDLMIVKVDADDTDLSTVFPELKLTVDVNGAVEAAFKKGEFDALELQYRKAGTEMWQAADKSTNSPIIFTPPASAATEKYEFRAVYLIKNHRVGQWSPIYTIAVG